MAFKSPSLTATTHCARLTGRLERWGEPLTVVPEGSAPIAGLSALHRGETREVLWRSIPKHSGLVRVWALAST